MKKGIIILAVAIVAILVFTSPDDGEPAPAAPSPDFQQALDDFKDSWNALKEGVQAVGDDVSTAIDETTAALTDTKNSIEEVTGVGSVSRLLDGGNSFAYDCAVAWFQSYTANIGVQIEISGNSLISVERTKKHAEDSVLGDCSKYAVTFLALIDPDGEMPINDSVTITIYTATDGSGHFLVTEILDDWRIFANTFNSYRKYVAG